MAISQERRAFIKELRNRRLGRFKEMLAEYNHAVKADPSDAWAYIKRGQFWHELNRLSLALSDHKKAFKADPTGLFISQICLDFYEAHGFTKEAIDACEHIIKLKTAGKGLKKWARNRRHVLKATVKSGIHSLYPARI